MVSYPADWEVILLGSKCEITSSKRVFESEWKKSGIPFLRTRDIANFHAGIEQRDKLFISEDTYRKKIAVSGEVKKGDLLVTGVGTIGLPFIVETDEKLYFKDGNIIWVKQSKDINPKFLYYLFLSATVQAQIVSFCDFTTVGTFTIKNAKKIKIPLPPLEEQTAIADTLAVFDTHISNLTELISKKKAIREGALNELMTGRTRLKGFCGEWEVRRLGEIGTFTKGAPFSKADISASGTPMILYGELYTTYKEVTYSVQKHTQRKAKAQCYSTVGDVIIPASGETAEDISRATCVMIPGVVLAGDLHIFRTDKLDGRFLSYAINHVINRQISEIAQGISIMHINAKGLSKIAVHYPTLQEQTAIADTLTALDTEISSLEAERLKISQIRDGAMNDLLTGKVRLTHGN